MNLPISGDSSFFMNLYARYRRDPQSVPSDWVVHFETLDGRPLCTDQDSALAVQALVDAYRAHGHREARLDPLELLKRIQAAEITAARSRVSSAPIELSVAGRAVSVPGDRAAEILHNIYSGHAALEAAQISDSADRAWIYETFEREMLSEATKTHSLKLSNPSCSRTSLSASSRQNGLPRSDLALRVRNPRRSS